MLNIFTQTIIHFMRDNYFQYKTVNTIFSQDVGGSIGYNHDSQMDFKSKSNNPFYRPIMVLNFCILNNLR